MTPPSLPAPGAGDRTPAPACPRTSPSASPSASRTASRLAPFALALLLGGCLSEEVLVVGRPPEGEVKAYETVYARRQRERLEEAVARRAREGNVSEPRPEPKEIGPVQTDRRKRDRYHRPWCGLLAEVPQEDREEYPDPYRAVDAGMAPCATCDPGP